jgi:hypothetical protein
MDEPFTQLLNDIARKAELCVDEFAPRGLSNVTWGFATLCHNAPSLFDAIAIAAQARINEFQPQGLANMIWAYANAKMNHRSSPLLIDAIARAAPVQIVEFNPQDLSKTAWAFAILNHEAPPLLKAIAPAAQAQINEIIHIVFPTQRGHSQR